MLTNTRLAIYIMFIVALAIWTGAGIHDTIGSHTAWFANPVAYIQSSAAPDGAVNPWPYTTGLLVLCTLAAMAAFLPYRGLGRRQMIFVLAVITVILVATGAYFVPTLMKLGNHATLGEEQIISMSRTWIRLNIARQILLVALLIYSLVLLTRMSSARPR